jgi:N-acyl homoserine lactone hydrolase
LRVLTDNQWTEWLPIFAWVIDHPEGIFVVDTGETARSTEPGYFPGWHPYYRSSVRMDVKPEDEIGIQLIKMGINSKDVTTLILTHFHTDHAGGLRHFPESKILVSGPDYQLARSFTGKLLGYLPQRWPKWFTPQPIKFENDALGPFERSYSLTQAGDVLIIPTPGHTPGHVSVVVEKEDVTYFLAGDTSYNQHLLLERIPDGVSPKADVTLSTLERINKLARIRPLVYLPTHDPQSARRLVEIETVAHQVNEKELAYA